MVTTKDSAQQSAVQVEQNLASMDSRTRDPDIKGLECKLLGQMDAK